MEIELKQKDLDMLLTSGDFEAAYREFESEMKDIEGNNSLDRYKHKSIYEELKRKAARRLVAKMTMRHIRMLSNRHREKVREAYNHPKEEVVNE